MIETNEVGFDKLAFYVGGVSTCASCQIRKAEIKMIEKLIPKIAKNVKTKLCHYALFL